MLGMFAEQGWHLLTAPNFKNISERPEITLIQRSTDIFKCNTLYLHSLSYQETVHAN